MMCPPVTAGAGARIPAPTCTTNSVLCKVQPLIELSCLLYNPALLAQQYPDIIVLASGFDRAAIMWYDLFHSYLMSHAFSCRFEPINTAVFIFANLQNIYDSWLNPNVNGYQEGVPFFSQRVLGMEPSLYGATASLFERNLGGIPTVYTQFADGFSALQAASNRQFACTGLLQCFNALSARAEPTNVILVGHALGGAYATVGGPWAAIAFPQSTIQVATAGAPAVVANNLFYVVRRAAFHTAYHHAPVTYLHVGTLHMCPCRCTTAWWVRPTTWSTAATPSPVTLGACRARSWACRAACTSTTRSWRCRCVVVCVRTVPHAISQMGTPFFQSFGVAPPTCHSRTRIAVCT